MKRSRVARIARFALLTLLALCALLLFAGGAFSEEEYLTSFDELTLTPKARGRALGERIVVLYKDAKADQVATLRLKRRSVQSGASLTPRVDVITLTPAMDADATLASLAANPNVAAVDFERTYQMHGLPNDPLMLDAWYFTKIGADETWDAVVGKTPVCVAVLDSGVDTTHADLAGRLTAGYDFINNTPVMTDLRGHGTSVIGCAVAAANNAIGFAGVSGIAEVRVAPYRVGGKTATDTNIYLSAVVAAIDEVLTNRSDVRVLNMSFGSPIDSAPLRAAIQRARDKGLVIVASAGNDGATDLLYPASYDGVISVTATSETDAIMTGSQHNSAVDLCAPGVRILTTEIGGAYRFATGTSFAAPIVSACCAVLLSDRPTLTAAAVEDILRATSLDLGARGWDPVFGAGRVRLADALDYPLAYGSLTLKNVIVGADRAFTFDFNCTTGGAYPYSGSASGVLSCGGTITLRGGQQITITGIPVRAIYTFVEREAGMYGYRTSATNDQSTVRASGTTVTFVNRGGKKPPPTGDDAQVAAWLALALAAALGAAWLAAHGAGSASREAGAAGGSKRRGN